MNPIKSLFCKHRDFVFSFERKNKYTIIKMTCPDCGKIKYNVTSTNNIAASEKNNNVDWFV